MTTEQAYDLPAVVPTTVVLPAPDRSARAEAVSEFTREMEDYKRRHNRPFPTWSEVLEVLRQLGYVRRPVLAPAVRYRVRINQAGAEAERIAEILEQFGGSPLGPPGSRQYRFPDEAARARALDAARAAQGWTCVET